MKGKGIALFVGLLVVLVGVLAYWKLGKGDKHATPAVTQENGSAVPSSSLSPTATKAAKITVTVKDAKGPIGDAYVRFAPEDGEVLAVKTGANGAATADLLPGSYEISASATGHEPAALPRADVTADASFEITLVVGGRVLSGVVTDVSGGPIAGARVDAAKLGAMARPERAIASTLSGPDGKYQLAVAEGQLLVAARSPDYAAQSRIVDVGPSGATADFALVPGGVIEGIVLDAQTRAPVVGAIVEARRDSAAIMLAETRGAVATTGADGKFRVAGLRPGAWELDARGEGRRTKAPTLVGLGIAEQVTDVELLVGKSPVIRGVVVDENAAPVKGASVTAFARGSGERAKADDKGAFVIEGLAPGRYMLIGSSSEHFGDMGPPVMLEDKDVNDVVVRVKKGAKLLGRVEPPQVCDIKAEADDGGRGPGGGMRMMRLTTPVQSGADGKFEIVPVEEGKQGLEARCASGDQGKVAVDVKPGTTEVVIAVKPGSAIAGRVLDGEGKAVAGVSVMASPLAGGESTMIVNGVITSGVQALTNGAGAYEVRGLAAGTYRMSVLDRGRPMKLKAKSPKVELAAAAKKTGVDLTVDRPNGVIKGVVTGPDGKPLADAWVSVNQDLESLLEGMIPEGEDAPQGRMMRVEARDEDDGTGVGGASGFAPALTDAQGRFEIRNLPKAKYDVIAEAQAGKLRGRAPKIEPDAEVKIQALGVTTLSGTVKSATGPTALFTIELEGPTRAARTFTDGKFELGRVDPGNYVVRVSSSDGNAEAKVTVSQGQPATVDITLVANAIVSGTIVDGEGKPLPGVPVVVIEDEGEGRLSIRMEGPPITSGPDGKFRIEHEAGKGALVVMTPPSPIVKRGLVLEAGKTHDVGQIKVGAPAAPEAPDASPVPERRIGATAPAPTP
jgi:Carboxypeptidase regulatory-like domain